jgi:hypothetical protein
MHNVDDIKAQFPHPVTGNETIQHCADGDYCVGGAVCLYAVKVGFHVEAIKFPSEYNLGPVLQELNPHLEETQALELAKRIIAANDAGCFAKAWCFVDIALQTRSKA